ncbi:MAG: glycosyl transferase [Aquabacterium sp.]|nr:MAG: glycosyl transferase [Aquabacterium sp.]
MPVALEWLIWAFATSFAVCAGLIVTQKWHGRLTLDHDTQGVQKLHKHPVPRIGGAALATGLLVAGLGSWLSNASDGTALVLALCAVPTFLAGLIEDLTKRVSVRRRLIASFASPLLAVIFLDAQLTRLDTPLLDSLMTFAPLAILFTVFAVGGMTNAINIIDGLNGLASGSVALMLAGLGCIAWLHNDMLVVQLCGVGVAAVVGFMLLNYPFGRIFLGDGGAYLLGFWLAECAVLLLMRNPEVSTWAALTACLYPFWETMFSMYRRTVIRRAASGRPDNMHFHHLLYRRVVTQRLGARAPAWRRHALTSGLIWSGVLLCQFEAAAASTNSEFLMIGALSFAVAYMWLYLGIVRSSHPHDIALSAAAHVPVEER